MIRDLKKTWAIFAPAERRKVVWMLLLVMLMAVVETVSVVSIMPFLSVLARPAIVQENPSCRDRYEPGNRLDQRRLSGSIRSEDSNDLVGLNRE